MSIISMAYSLSSARSPLAPGYEADEDDWNLFLNVFVINIDVTVLFLFFLSPSENLENFLMKTFVFNHLLASLFRFCKHW